MTDNSNHDTPRTDTPRTDTPSSETSTTPSMRTSTVDESAPSATMGEFTHSNPHTGQTFGDELVFHRGATVAADGGRADAEPGEDEAETMKDVDHEHPHDGAADANRVFARGHDETSDAAGEDDRDERADPV